MTAPVTTPLPEILRSADLARLLPARRGTSRSPGGGTRWRYVDALAGHAVALLTPVAWVGVGFLLGALWMRAGGFAGPLLGGRS